MIPLPPVTICGLYHEYKKTSLYEGRASLLHLRANGTYSLRRTNWYPVKSTRVEPWPVHLSNGNWVLKNDDDGCLCVLVGKQEMNLDDWKFSPKNVVESNWNWKGGARSHVLQYPNWECYKKSVPIRIPDQIWHQTKVSWEHFFLWDVEIFPRLSFRNIFACSLVCKQWEIKLNNYDLRYLMWKNCEEWWKLNYAPEITERYRVLSIGKKRLKYLNILKNNLFVASLDVAANIESMEKSHNFLLKVKLAYFSDRVQNK